RQREFALRAALGASASQLARQLLIETLILTAAGCALGFVVASWSLQAVLLSAPMGLSPLRPGAIGARAWLFAAGLTTRTTLAIGALPALRLSRRAPQEALTAASRSATEGTHGVRLRRALVAGEVALSAASLVCAGLLLTSFVRLMRVDAGIVSDH